MRSSWFLVRMSDRYASRFVSSCMGLKVLVFLFISIASALHPPSTCQETPMQSQSSCWDQLPSPVVSKVQIAVLPLGSTEAHGPHLPLGTDTMIAAALCSHATNALPGVAVLPSIPFGASFEHAEYAGTIAVRDETLNSYWSDVISSLVRSGMRKIILVNGHGGQTSNVDIAIRNARFHHDALTVSFNVQAMLSSAYERHMSQLGANSGEHIDESELKSGIHGGRIETSVMLHLHPTLVRQQHMRNFSPLWKKRSQLEPHGRIVSYGWRSQDICEQGAVGDASRASAELGANLFNDSVSVLRALIVDLLDLKPRDILNLT